MSISMQDLEQLLQGTGLDPVSMMTASPGSALQNEFMQTPGYQLQYGNNTNLDPSMRFMSDPGVQMAVTQGSLPLFNNYAARGLGQSGALSQALAQYMYGNYNNYVGGQSSLFNNYQTQLAGLTNLGAQTSGAQNAFTSGQNLAGIDANANLATGQQLSNANLATGQNISNANLATGSNVSSLLGNQGVLNAGAYLNTGAAQANNLFQGMSLLSQLNQATIANSNGQQSSLLKGQGAMAGAGQTSGANGLQGGLF